MEDPTRAENERDSNAERESPHEITTRGSGLAERDAIGPQAERLSPTGARIDTDATPEQVDIMRKGSAT